MFAVRLTRIKTDHNRMRDDVIEGVSGFYPTVGQKFIMYSRSRSEPENPDAVRIVNTSVVKEMKCNTVDNKPNFVVTTESGSIYEILILDDRFHFSGANA